MFLRDNPKIAAAIDDLNRMVEAEFKAGRSRIMAWSFTAIAPDGAVIKRSVVTGGCTCPDCIRAVADGAQIPLRELDGFAARNAAGLVH